MADTNERTPLLKVEPLSKEFPAESGMFAKRFSKRVVSAVNDISFEIYPGETFGLVGESGCGKSTTGRTIMRLTKPTAGKVFFQGKDVAEMSKHEIKDMRREMQFIFQDPYASLNPRMTIGEIVSEPMTIHGVGTKEERIERVRESEPRAHQPLSARVLGRPAPACRHRPRVRSEAQADHLRRARLCT